MKFKIIILVFCLFIAKNTYACAFDPPPLLNEPSYIDPDYTYINLDYRSSEYISKYSESYYGQRNLFGRILNQYQKDLSSKDIDDSNARLNSKLKEPKLYEKYLEGAKQFNSLAYENALKIFTELRDSQKSLKEYSWVKEASTYMIARCKLIMAQTNWDGYSNPNKTIYQKNLQEAEDFYKLYLKEYPQGLYADSALNIRRKILYLADNQTELDAELKIAISKIFSTFIKRSSTDIIGEFKQYFRGNIDISKDSPVLITYALINSKEIKAEDISSLEAREKDFLAYPNLFSYLRAFSLYRLGKYQDLLNKTPEQPLTKDLISLSTQLLRFRALLQLGKTNEALAAIEKIHKISPEDSVELEMAYLKINNRDGLWLYKKNSPLKSEKVLRGFAKFGLTDVELENGIKNKEIEGDKRKFLIDELALRHLLSKRFKELSSLLENEQGTGIFTSLKSAMAILAKKPNDAQALVDTGEFIYKNYINPNKILFNFQNPTFRSSDGFAELFYYISDDLLNKCKLCISSKDNLKKYTPPIALFNSVIETAKKSGKKSEAEAKALHYTTLCMKKHPQYRCIWGENLDKNPQQYLSSKEAFTRLHEVYKDSSWAAKTPYFY